VDNDLECPDILETIEITHYKRGKGKSLKEKSQRDYGSN